MTFIDEDVSLWFLSVRVIHIIYHTIYKTILNLEVRWSFQAVSLKVYDFGHMFLVDETQFYILDAISEIISNSLSYRLYCLQTKVYCSHNPLWVAIRSVGWSAGSYSWLYMTIIPDSTVHETNMGPIWGPTGPKWAPCWPHERCYLGWLASITNPYSLTYRSQPFAIK